MECKVRCINFRRVSDPRRAIRTAVGITETSDDWYRTTKGEMVICLGTPQRAGEIFGCAWELLEAPATSPG